MNAGSRPNGKDRRLVKWISEPELGEDPCEANHLDASFSPINIGKEG